MACDGAGNAAGDMAAEYVVAAEGADRFDLVGGGWVGAVVELLALARGGFCGEEAAVGR